MIFWGPYTRGGYTGEFPDGGLYPKRRGIIVSMSKNVVDSFDNAIDHSCFVILYIEEIVKLHRQAKQFLKLRFLLFYCDFEEKRVKTFRKSVCLVYSPIDHIRGNLSSVARKGGGEL